MRLLLVAVGMITLLLLPARSQEPPQTEQQFMQREIERRDREDRQRRERAEQADKAYQRQLKNSTSSPTPKTDPWGNVRDSTQTRKQN